MSLSKKAVVASVDLGFAQIDGLMLPDGSYAVAVPQLAALNLIPPNRSLKQLESLLGLGLQSHEKVASELHPKKINILRLDDLVQVIRALDRKGNPVAAAMIDAMLAESFERRFDRAFDKRVSEDERNQALRLRMERLLARHKYTATLRDRYVALLGVAPEPQQYKAWTVKVNRVLFGRDHFNCDRDNMTHAQQQRISQFETFVDIRAEKHPTEHPDALIERVLAVFDD